MSPFVVFSRPQASAGHYCGEGGLIWLILFYSHFTVAFWVPQCGACNEFKTCFWLALSCRTYWKLVQMCCNTRCWKERNSSIWKAVCTGSFTLPGNNTLHTKQRGSTNLFLAVHSNPQCENNPFILAKPRFLSSFSVRLFLFTIWYKLNMPQSSNFHQIMIYLFSLQPE